jgi:single-stranded-DNA-specific exonuclease
MPAMAEAVERINAAIESGERILIFGDRDVDGITATVLLHEALADLGADVQWMLPEGEDAYGLTDKVIDKVSEAGARLLLTVDCGVSNGPEIALAADRGIETIVIDHHNPPPELPPAFAVVNPKLPGYPFRDLCGCAVASKVDWALRFSRSPFFGASFCLLNARPGNETMIVEAVRVTNLVETGRVAENIVPGMVPYQSTRLAGFIGSDEILVLDAQGQSRLLVRAFGPDIEFSLSDIAPLVAEFLPELSGKGLIRLQQELKEVRYSSRPLAEIDILEKTFVRLVLKREEERIAPVFNRMDLVALGTLADLMPLSDENRILVRLGLSRMRSAERNGLRQVFKRKDLLGKRISTVDIAWQIAPLLNSAGRMGEPSKATRLFLSETAEEAEAIVEQLFALDSQRRNMGEATWNLLLAQARECHESTGKRCVLVHDARIQRGITGIMASRLQGFFKAPAIVIAEGPDSAVGSIRCNRDGVIAGFFARYGDFFLNFGGHDFAGGFSLERAKVEPFLAAFFEGVEDFAPAMEAEESIAIDAELPAAYLTPDLQRVVDAFEPYGEGNPALTFMTRGVKIAHCELIGRRELSHLKLLLEVGSLKWPAVYWNAAARFPSDFTVGDTVDIVYRLGRNTYGGGENLQLVIVDIQR